MEDLQVKKPSQQRPKWIFYISISKWIETYAGEERKKKEERKRKERKKEKKRKEKIYILGRTIDLYPLELIFLKESKDLKSSPCN